MKQAVADTSALISLALSGQLKKITETIELLIPAQVKKELDEIAAFSDEKATAAKTVLSLVNAGQIHSRSISNPKTAIDLMDKNIDQGEAECFRLAIEQKIPILLMDDLTASFALHSRAMAHTIRIRLSAAAIVELVNQKKISGKEAKKNLKKMIQHRNWEKTTLEYLIQKHFP